MRAIFAISIVTLGFLQHFHFAHAQNLQQLSYAQAEVAQVLIRPHIVVSTEQPVSTTTAKPGFLNGIRNFFSRNSPPSSTPSTTTVPTNTVILPTSTGQNATAGYVSTNNGIRLYAGGNNLLNRNLNGTRPTSAVTIKPTAAPRASTIAPISSSLPTAAPRPQTSSTQASPIQTPRTQEDFPALGPPRRSRPDANVNPSTTVTSTLAPAWSLAAEQNRQNAFTEGTTSASLHGYSTTTTKYPDLATAEEIEDITETLLTKSSPNLMPYLMVNLQGRTHSYAKSDEAPLPLLTVNETVLNATPTLVKMRLLFNNYEIDTTTNEYVSPIERQEETEFLDSILATPVMKAAMRFLQQKGIVTADQMAQFDLLRTIWFENYSRSMGKIGSSAFEHVFLNEIKNHSTVSGLHNWVWYYLKEGQSGEQHSIDYKGYMNSVLLGNKGQVVKYRFSYNNIDKPVNAMFIGTPPEFDMAVYTICFMVKPNRGCPVSFANMKFIIRTHTFKYRGKRLIGSAFPEI